jgi:hypothetical protein
MAVGGLGTRETRLHLIRLVGDDGAAFHDTRDSNASAKQRIRLLPRVMASVEAFIGITALTS